MVQHQNYQAQAECLQEIIKCIRKNIYPPTLREITKLVSPNKSGNPPSDSTIKRWMHGLEDAGLITYALKKTRGIVPTLRGWLVGSWDHDRIEEYLEAGDFRLPAIATSVAAIVSLNSEKKILEIFSLVSDYPPTIVIDNECLPAFNYGFNLFKRGILEILGVPED
ncbi:hypothetical protein LCGC14_0917920 [marine sediment metagenome]|uniref:Uncharacterized protein n=1 Tax=marine sediment metagenome TaxID=412755 RepID=A0A0F9PCD7_9ZZZZ